MFFTSSILFIRDYFLHENWEFCSHSQMFKAFLVEPGSHL